MTTTAITEQVKTTVTAEGVRLKIDGTDPVYGDFRDDLARDGYAVVKGAVPKERALQYASRMLGLLESLYVSQIVITHVLNSNHSMNSGLGYDRKDPSTVHPDKLPVINEKGMLLNYAAAHEDFVWAIRSEEGVVSSFEKVYNDNDLIVSFDAINYGFANRTNLKPNNPWPHQDQVCLY